MQEKMSLMSLASASGWGGGMEVGCCGSEVHQHTSDVTPDAMGIGVAL